MYKSVMYAVADAQSGGEFLAYLGIAGFLCFLCVCRCCCSHGIWDEGDSWER